jgi:hypothetical protein
MPHVAHCSTLTERTLHPRFFRGVFCDPMIENKVPNFLWVVWQAEIYKHLATTTRNQLTPEVRPAVGKSPQRTVGHFPTMNAGIHSGARSVGRLSQERHEGHASKQLDDYLSRRL